MNVSDIQFGNTNLNEALGASKVAIHDFSAMPQAENNIAHIAGSHRSTITSKYYASKIARATLYSSGDLTTLRAKVGLLKKNLQHKQLPLTVDIGQPLLVDGVYAFDTTVETQFSAATIDSIEIRYTKGSYAVDITFILLDPVGKSLTPQTLADIESSTVSSLSVDLSTIDIQGTFDTQYPVYEITINSVTNGSNPSISVSNGFNVLTYTGPLAAADVIVVDTDLLTVELNGVMVDYSGTMPELILSSPALTVSNTLTARNIDILITNQPRYI